MSGCCICWHSFMDLIFSLPSVFTTWQIHTYWLLPSKKLSYLQAFSSKWKKNISVVAMTSFICLFKKTLLWEKFCLLQHLSDVKVPRICMQACIHTNIDITCACMTFMKALCGLRIGRRRKEAFGREITSMTSSMKPTGKWAAVVEEVKDNMQKNHQHERGCSPCGTSSKQRINLLNHLCTWNSARKEKEHLSHCSVFLHHQMKRKKRM